MAEARPDWFYLCLNCGGVAHVDDWTAWQYDHDGEHGPEGALIPNPPGESDPLLKCPRCGELHGDCYQGAGIEDGTEAECRAERARLLLADPDAFEEVSTDV